MEIVGEGERNYIIELNKIIKQLELKRVAIRKPVFGIEKSKLYFKSNLLILPTNNENFGMVVAKISTWSSYNCIQRSAMG